MNYIKINFTCFFLIWLLENLKTAVAYIIFLLENTVKKIREFMLYSYREMLPQKALPIAIPANLAEPVSFTVLF